MSTTFQLHFKICLLWFLLEKLCSFYTHLFCCTEMRWLFISSTTIWVTSIVYRWVNSTLPSSSLIQISPHFINTLFTLSGHFGNELIKTVMRRHIFCLPLPVLVYPQLKGMHISKAEVCLFVYFEHLQRRNRFIDKNKAGAEEITIWSLDVLIESLDNRPYCQKEYWAVHCVRDPTKKGHGALQSYSIAKNAAPSSSITEVVLFYMPANCPLHCVHATRLDLLST